MNGNERRQDEGAEQPHGRPVRDGAIRPVAAPAASDARAPRIRRATFMPSVNVIVGSAKA
jgi:hypothetical protein